jgi:hypothetical protein
MTSTAVSAITVERQPDLDRVTELYDLVYEPSTKWATTGPRPLLYSRSDFEQLCADPDTMLAVLTDESGPAAMLAITLRADTCAELDRNWVRAKQPFFSPLAFLWFIASAKPSLGYIKELLSEMYHLTTAKGYTILFDAPATEDPSREGFAAMFDLVASNGQTLKLVSAQHFYAIEPGDADRVAADTIDLRN